MVFKLLHDGGGINIKITFTVISLKAYLSLISLEASLNLAGQSLHAKSKAANNPGRRPRRSND
jgi:hypothetical protein